MVFGAIELTNGIFLRQTLTVAAYEGGRAACRAGGTAQGARQRIEEILRARGVERQEIVITPNVTAATPRGTLINVTVRTSGDTRLTTPFTRYLQGRSLEHTVVMVRL
jgi:Flp pilus assembly protein TadG